MSTPTWDETSPVDHAATPTWESTQPLQKKAPEWSDIPDNIMSGIAEAPTELANLVKGLGTPWPVRAMNSVTDGVATGHPVQGVLRAIPGAPIAEGLYDTAKNWGAGELAHGDFSGAAEKAKANIIEHPIRSAVDVASVAAPMFGEGAAVKAGGAMEEGAVRASRLAQEQAVKSLEGAVGQVRQLGPEEARAAGQMALDKGIVSPFTPTSLGMERALKTAVSEEGKGIGSLRAAGDAAGAAPEPSLLRNNIEAALAPKYEKGMRSGQMGGLQNALDEVGSIQDPTFVGNARKATEMHEFAAKNRMLLPEGPTTDVANSLSRANDAGLQEVLSPEQWEQYKTHLKDFGTLQDIGKFFERGEARELAGRGMGPVSDLYKGAKDVIGHKATAYVADKAASALRTGSQGILNIVQNNPNLIKYGPALMNASQRGAASVSATHFMLMQNDPDYNKSFMEGQEAANGAK